jgi:hypothetical protein
MDFIFKFQGGLSDKQFKQKTAKLSSLPKHLKYTLLNKNETMKKIHKKEFPEAFFPYNELKEKGNREYKRKRYREAIEYYYNVTFGVNTVL